MTFIVYLIIGILAGTLSGLLGVGGGVIVVPALILLFQWLHLFPDVLLMHIAVGTSLAIMILTSLASASAYYQRGFIIWPVFFRFLPGLCLGMILGSMVASNVSSKQLIIFFAIFLIIIALYLFFSKSKEDLEKTTLTQALPESNPIVKIKKTLPLARELLMSVVSIVIGLLSTVFGIGGGLLMVPFFLSIDLKIHEASGTSSLCGVPISIIGTIILTISGWNTMQHFPSGTIGYVYWPAAAGVSLLSIVFAPIGTRLSVRFRPRTLKIILGFLLIISSINLLFLH